jgi:transposase-like protein
MVRSTVEETLNGLLDAEADARCQAMRYERNSERANCYTRKLHTKAGGGAEGAQAEVCQIRKRDHQP